MGNRNTSLVDKGLAALGVVGFIGAVVAGIGGQELASYLMIGLALVSWLTWLTTEVWSLRQNLAEKQSTAFGALGPQIEAFPKPVKISSDKKNRFKIRSEFLLWETCSIMLWVKVPPKGTGLRDSPSNRYLLAHSTGRIDSAKHKYYNQFSLRHTKSRGSWNISVSNAKGEYSSRRIEIKDGLAPGWHHFFVTWDRARPALLFAIDAGDSGNDIAEDIFQSWPERLGGSVVVGGWVSTYPGHYCETEVSRLVIYDRWLELQSDEVQSHRMGKPSS